MEVCVKLLEEKHTFFRALFLWNLSSTYQLLGSHSKPVCIQPAPSPCR